jgi:hypothetical protein
MNFLHPEFLYLAPLLAVPILIHLLNRVRYRRMRWAAIKFLMATERRAVRRARLRQILLMVLRTLVLAFALGALAQPIFSGSLGSLLGGADQVAVALDASASMSAEDAGGSAFDRAKRMAAAEVTGLPRAARVTAGTFAVWWDSPYREPVQDHGAVAAFIESAVLTGGGTDVPQAIRGAAEALARGSGGGTIWLLTDRRETGWNVGGPGAWAEVRQALEKAGRPRIVISDLGPTVVANYSISKVHVTPEVLMDGDVPRLTATVRLDGAASGPKQVRLMVDGRSVDAPSVDLKAAGTADVVFRLPALKGAVQTGHLELEHDAMPADDRSWFLLRPATSLPVLVVSGVVSTRPFEGSGDFLAAAIQPPAGEAGARSPFVAKSIAAKDLSRVAPADYAAVFLADVPRLATDVAATLRQYVARGGLLLVFPGSSTDAASWNETGLLPGKIETAVEDPAENRRKVAGVAPASPITATLPAEGLDHLLVTRHYRLAADPSSEVLATLDGGDPLIVRSQVGKGRVYLFAVSAQSDSSNLPFTPVFLSTLHRILLGHLGEVREPPSLPTFTPLEFAAKNAAALVVTPGGKPMPLVRREDRPDRLFFEHTEAAGLYQLAADGEAEAVKSAVPVAAMNVPPEESTVAKIEPAAIRTLLDGSSVYFLETDGNLSQAGAQAGAAGAVSGFPLAVLAMLLLLGEVLVAWSMGRPPAAPVDRVSV